MYHGEGNNITASGKTIYKVYDNINAESIAVYGKEFEGKITFARFFSYEPYYEVIINSENREEVIAELKKI
jgi:broad-specificity NMP kinase